MVLPSSKTQPHLRLVPSQGVKHASVDPLQLGYTCSPSAMGLQTPLTTLPISGLSDALSQRLVHLDSGEGEQLPNNKKMVARITIKEMRINDTSYKSAKE